LGPSGVPVITQAFGNVGTNGNLTEAGNPTTVWGSLSTPRAGVGSCTSNNVTAQTISGNASVEGGLIQLPQPIEFPPPPEISPLPGTAPTNFSGNCGSAPNCTIVSGAPTITPPGGPGGTVTMGNVSLT